MDITLIAQVSPCRYPVAIIYKHWSDAFEVIYRHARKSCVVWFSSADLASLTVEVIFNLGAHYHNARCDNARGFSNDLLALPIPDPNPDLVEALEVIGQKPYWPCCWKGKINIEGIGDVIVSISPGSEPSTVDVDLDDGHLIRAMGIPPHLTELLLKAAASVRGGRVKIVAKQPDGEAHLTAWGNTAIFPSAEAAITALLLGNAPKWR